MEFGQRQLGVKKGSGKPLDRVPSQGFFCGGSLMVGRPANNWKSVGSTPARQAPNFSDNLCRRWRGSLTVGKCLSRLLVAEHCCRYRYCPSAPFSYDIPSSKRDLARCTNNLHTGATLQVWAKEQRLRKGFQRQWRGSLIMRTKIAIESDVLLSGGCGYCRPTACPESLSSAAEIRHSARNTRL